ncbi:MAG: ATP-binding protein [Pyrinomonadaceae bacterium]
MLAIFKLNSRFIIHKGKPPVRAVYRKPELAEFEGNPLIEALPPIWTTEHVMKLLNRQPFNTDYVSLPDKVRYLKIQEALTFFVPLDIHLDLEESFSSVIRMGYLGRNPRKEDYWKKIDKQLETFDQYTDQYESNEDPSWTASGFNIVGISGVGKSRSVLRILNLYPQVIHHSKYKNKLFTESQIVWLKVECPRDGSLKDLCLSFFYSVDCILGTNYLETYSKGKPTIDELLLSMEIVASNHFLGVLVIDEIQRLSFAKSGGDTAMLNFFVKLINSIGVPVSLIGTYKAISVLSGEFSQTRRGTGQGDVVWHRMENDEQWGLFVGTMWKHQYTKQKVELTEKLKKALYEESQGITDFAVKLFYFAQKRAIESGSEKITVGIIRSVAKEKLNMPRKILNALKTGDMRVLRMFEDVYPRDFEDNFTVSTLQESESKENTDVSPQNKSNQSIHITMELSPFNKSDDTQITNKSKEKSKKSKSGTREYGRHPNKIADLSFENKRRLIRLTSKNEKSENSDAYSILKEAGFMRPSSEFYSY